MSDAPVPAHYETEFRACLAEAAQDGRGLMDRMVNAARQSLQMRDTAARDFHERNAVSHALHLLGKHGPTMVVAYPLALEAAFAEASAAGTRASKPAVAASLSFDQLELMDESQVQDRVAQARAQQVALHGADQELAELNPLICAAQGLKTVQPERNPLRPEIYIKALQEVIEQTRASSDTRLGWMQHMCPVLGKELGGIYLRVAERLRASGVRAAGYAVLQTPSAVPARPAAQPGQESLEDEAAQLQALEEELLTVDKLRSLLAGELDAGVGPLSSYSAALEGGASRQAAARQAPAGETGFASTVPAALDALHQMNQVDEAMQRMAQRRTAEETTAPAVRQDARGVSQALGAEVVGLMVENIAKDERLLEPVRRAVREMEPALRRLARIDPRFFSDKEHPARRLLDEVTQRSLAYESVEASGFGPFLRPLQLAVGQLDASTIESAQPFEAALEALQQIWGDQSREERRQREKAVKALLHAEQRNLLAEKIRSDILSWPDTANVAPEVMAFVCGPWAQVMAEARLSDRAGAGDPGGYSGLVPGLLWSAQPALARNNLAKLTKLIPVLLAKLREGLKTIDYPAVQASAFFETLIGLHQRALEAPARGGEAAARPKAAGDWRVAARPPASPKPQPGEPATPWLAPQEAAQSGFMEMGEAFPDEAKASAPAAPEPVAVRDAGELVLGSWVELLADGQWTRTQLTWASPHGTLFLFTNAAGSTQSMTRRLLDKLLVEGGIRIVALQPVVDGALDAVAQAAMRNSVEPRKG